MSRDIEKGSRWDDVISDKLDACNFGIICLTPENLGSEWLLFESGALSKKVREARVCTYLFGLAEGDVSGPLAKFQHTRAERSDTAALLENLNTLLGENRLDADRFRATLDQWWPALENQLQAIRDMPVANAPAMRSSDDKIDELLLEVRSVQHTLQRVVRRQDAAEVRRALPTSALGTLLAYQPPFEQFEGAPVEASVRFMPSANAKRYRCRTHRLHPTFDNAEDDITIIHACCDAFMNELLSYFAPEEGPSTEKRSGD